MQEARLNYFNLDRLNTRNFTLIFKQSNFQQHQNLFVFLLFKIIQAFHFQFNDKNSLITICKLFKAQIRNLMSVCQLIQMPSTLNSLFLIVLFSVFIRQHMSKQKILLNEDVEYFFIQLKKSKYLPHIIQQIKYFNIQSTQQRYLDDSNHNYNMKLLSIAFKRCFSEITTYQPSNQMVRLSKWMSLKSLCSRREAEQFIQLGLVRVDGKRIFENMLVPIDANLKAFTPIGIKMQKPIVKLWMINKPRGYICTHRDPQKRKTIYELLPKQLNMFGHLMTVGRLDFNSEGLLLITNDNTLKGLLENPEANLTRFYRVKVHGRVTPQKLDKMSNPLIIKGIQYGPLNVGIDRQLATNSWLNVSMRTGKNREIRRIMEKCDLQVNKLIRQSYGPYKKGALQHGEVAEIPISNALERKLKQTKAKELQALQKGASSSLIEVDIRNRAIGLAKYESQTRQIDGKTDQKYKPKQLPKSEDDYEQQEEQ